MGSCCSKTFFFEKHYSALQGRIKNTLILRHSQLESSYYDRDNTNIGKSKKYSDVTPYDFY